MTNKVTIQRLATGVPGLDDLLGGGIPEFSFNLLAGTPGSGKTTMAHQIMFSLATPERRALFFTVLGEPPLKMLRYQQQFPFFDIGKVNQSIKFVNLAADLSTATSTACWRVSSTRYATFRPAWCSSIPSVRWCSRPRAWTSAPPACSTSSSNSACR